jgi:hypothetical protein
MLHSTAWEGGVHLDSVSWVLQLSRPVEHDHDRHDRAFDAGVDQEAPAIGRDVVVVGDANVAAQFRCDQLCR